MNNQLIARKNTILAAIDATLLSDYPKKPAGNDGGWLGSVGDWSRGKQARLAVLRGLL